MGGSGDKELTQNYDFNKRVVADVNVYAQWLVNEEPITMYTIRYEDGTDNEAVFNTQSYTVASGSSTPLFIGTPTREGYTFMGWNPELQTTVSRNMTYRAQWQMNDGTPNPIDPITPVEPPQP
ncbi:InlB B-repeat-containing protein [Erysipelothrix sp. D19-032]